MIAALTGRRSTSGSSERHQHQNRADDQKPEGQHRAVRPLILSKTPAIRGAALLHGCCSPLGDARATRARRGSGSAGIVFATQLLVERPTSGRHPQPRSIPRLRSPSQRRFLAPPPPAGPLFSVSPPFASRALAGNSDRMCSVYGAGTAIAVALVVAPSGRETIAMQGSARQCGVIGCNGARGGHTHCHYVFASAGKCSRARQRHGDHV